MADNGGYDHAVRTAVDRIREFIPANLVGRFQETSGIRKGDFMAGKPGMAGRVCAVDGSNAVVMESGSMALALSRAAHSTFEDNERTARSMTPFIFSLIGPGVENMDFSALYEECFGEPPGTPLGNEDRERASGVLRDTVEFRVTTSMAETLPAGALLLRDGPLRVSHASHDPVLSRIEHTCRSRGIGLAGVSKRSTATWGGGHPLLFSVGGLAKELGVPAPWWIRIEPGILDHAQFPRWQHGEIYIAGLHPRAKSPLKIELPAGIPDETAMAVMDRLAACSADGRIPGYPYPLFDAHRAVALTREVVLQVRSDLVRRIAGSGMERQTYDIIFGDYHDEFARY